MGKDARGIQRYQCTSEDCSCKEFERGEGIRCGECNHTVRTTGNEKENFVVQPMKHSETRVVRPCSRCSCTNFEPPSKGSECDYCEHGEAEHCGTEKEEKEEEACVHCGKERVWVDPKSGKPSSWCSKKHRDACLKKKCHDEREILDQMAQLCIHCQKNPVFVNPETKQPSQWCKKSHRKKCVARGCHKGREEKDGSMCVHCKKREVFVDAEGVPSHFCSKGCQRDCLERSCHPAGNLCIHCGVKEVYVGEGETSHWCSMKHKKECQSSGCHDPEKGPRVALCLHCGKIPVFVDAQKGPSKFCSKKHRDECKKKGCHQPKGTAVILQASDSKYIELETQFKKKWAHSPGNAPAIVAIARIDAAFPKYEAYRMKVGKEVRASGKKRPPKGDGYDPGIFNERRRYHGTNQLCFFGLPGHLEPCNNGACSVCSIVKTNFRLSFAGKGRGWERFGNGIYVTSVSSKAADYTRQRQGAGLSTPTGGKVMQVFVCNVVCGNVTKLLQDDPSRTGPNPGDHSVLGEIGGSLNHDEYVIYTEEGIRPRYLIHYEV